MELMWEGFGMGLDDELRIGRPMEPFEVDGILYTPPWLQPYDPDEPLATTVHYGPMFDVKEDVYWAAEDF